MASERLGIGEVDTVVYADAAATLRELGLGGYTPAADRIFIAVDPSRQDDPDAFAKSFGLLLAHELHHAARWRSVGYGTTLREALITEGLACQFESELPDGDVPFYAKALTPAQLEEVRAVATLELDRATYDHAAWFFGSGGLPRHAGYALGFDVVNRYCRKSGALASGLVAKPAREFYRWR